MKILILYSTFTGNTQEAASALHEILREELPEHAYALANVRDIPIKKILEYPVVIFGTSTWEDENSPDTEKFISALREIVPDFSRITFALFGLGDSAFLNFCAAVPLVRDALILCHARVYKEIFTIDGYPTQEATKDLGVWATAFLEQLKAV